MDLVACVFWTIIVWLVFLYEAGALTLLMEAPLSLPVEGLWDLILTLAIGFGLFEWAAFLVGFTAQGWNLLADLQRYGAGGMCLRFSAGVGGLLYGLAFAAVSSQLVRWLW